MDYWYTVVFLGMGKLDNCPGPPTLLIKLSTPNSKYRVLCYFDFQKGIVCCNTPLPQDSLLSSVCWLLQR